MAACGPPRLGSSADSDNANEETTSLETGSDDGTHDPTATTSAFVPVVDASPGACDPLKQDCSNGEKCVPYASSGSTWDAFKCVPTLGNQATGEACTYAGPIEATDDCDDQSYCWNVMDVDGEGVGTCHAFCTGTWDAPMCPPMSACIITSGGVPALCLPTCDPVAQDCEEGQACYWNSNGFRCMFTNEDIPPGEACSYINDCAAGSHCTTAELTPNCEGGNCCMPFCSLMLGDQQCADVPGTTCVSFFEEDMAPPGLAHVGVCISPG
ncbi:hypothetical protein DB30_07511 [Enhygromyxa salina]|uniref:Uncharacterized protein n=1 Tax=Enhygromyxa salina TaxID=215803 RepID=A0A0C2CRP1_9BACT|nr:hypothetical protein DB30_07511 [Enhygromyxa salina]